MKVTSLKQLPKEEQTKKNVLDCCALFTFYHCENTEQTTQLHKSRNKNRVGGKKLVSVCVWKKKVSNLQNNTFTRGTKLH